MKGLKLSERSESCFRMGGSLACGFSYKSAESARKPWKYVDLVERCYILVYIMKGRGRYEDANGNSFEIRPGVLYQRFPGVRHSNYFRGGCEFFEAYMVLPRQVFELLYESKAVSLKRPCLDVGLRQDVYARFEGFLSELRSASESRLHPPLASMISFVSGLLSSGSASDEGPDSFSERACALLGRRLNERLSMPAAARRMGMGYTKFRQRFQATLGCPPGEYRTRRRLELAQSLLASQGVSIKEAAKAVGYPDVHSFSKQFKGYAGLTPGQFVKSRRRAP